MTLVSLLRHLALGFTELAREELALARTEIAAKARTIVVGGMFLVVALVAALAAIVAATTAAIFALSLVVTPWLAATIVMLTYVVVAAICALIARNKMVAAIPPTPTESIANVKENFQWAKTLMTSR